MSEVQDTNEAAIGQSGLTDGSGAGSLRLVYEKLNGGDFGSISIRMYAQTQDGVVLWKSGEVNLHEGDTVTLTGITGEQADPRQARGERHAFGVSGRTAALGDDGA